MYLKLNTNLGVEESVILAIIYLMIVLGCGFIIVRILALISLFDIDVDFLLVLRIVDIYSSSL